MLDLTNPFPPRPFILSPAQSDILSVSLIVTCAFVLFAVPPIVTVPVLLTFICALEVMVAAKKAIKVE